MMERLTEEKQIGPWASLKDKAESKPGAFADYDCLMAHMTAVTKLKYYEDMEEQGRLVVLPCQWGTKLYSIYAELYHLNEDGEPPIKEVWLVENNVCAIIRQFGKTVFLTSEEAENALKGGAVK